MAALGLTGQGRAILAFTPMGSFCPAMCYFRYRSADTGCPCYVFGSHYAGRKDGMGRVGRYSATVLV